LANPSILTVNRKPAEINMIEEFPYQAFGTTDLGSVVSGTSFLDLGIKLTVTPFVKQDDTGPYVQLKLNPEVSYASGSSNGVPIRAVRSSENIANVRDAQTLVIGGIFRNELRDLEEKVPGLGNIPLLGNLFKHKEKSDVRTELMVFVTPTIHTTPETVTWDRMIDVEQLRALNPESIVLKALGEQRQGAPLTEDEAGRADAGQGAGK
jgi:type II secretory pathway component GspD/PulD (secretin)